MRARLLSPVDAAESVAKRLRSSWAERVVVELHGDLHGERFDANLGEPSDVIEVPLRPGVSRSSAVEQLGFDTWSEWLELWRQVPFASLPGVIHESREIGVVGVPFSAPFHLRFETLQSAEQFVGLILEGRGSPDLQRARRVGSVLTECGVELTPARLKAVCRLTDDEVQVLRGVLLWLGEHPDLTEWTARQLPVPGMDSKWWQPRISLLSKLTGRDLERETRPRLSVVHLTYVDPEHLASGARRHDAWTSGDSHDLLYTPQTVLIVENRDCRLWFPEFPGAVVVEGSGKAAASLLENIDWVTCAQRLVYWGDIDSDGFVILNHLRETLGPSGIKVESLFMNDLAAARYARFGVSADPNGNPIKPSTSSLPNLTRAEAACYAAVATAGPAPFRRIEQERIPFGDAVEALHGILRNIGES